MKRFDRILHPGGLHRSRSGMILGVCKGISEYFDFSLFWTRAITIILLFFSGFWPILAIYFLAALLMKPEPAIPIYTDDEQEFYDSYISSRRSAADRLKRRYAKLEKRLQRLEHTVTAPEFDWDRRMNNGQ